MRVCPECNQKVGGDYRCLGLHLEYAHKMPHSVVVAVLTKMGYPTEGMNRIPFMKNPFKDSGTRKFADLLRKRLKS